MEQIDEVEASKESSEYNSSKLMKSKNKSSKNTSVFTNKNSKKNKGYTDEDI